MPSSPTHVNEDGAVFGFPTAICADCAHQQQDKPELYCAHNQTRAWFDSETGTWKMEWPVQPQNAA